MKERLGNMERKRVGSGSPWEDVVGYSRAVRVGPYVAVAGTTAMKDGEVVGPGDAYLQTRRALEIVVEALAELGAAPSDVVRTRVYTTVPEEWEAIGRAHREVFGQVRPAMTLLGVAAFIDPRLLVEIEADAVVAD
jgi:enamine deaminase RidA (YjgF/YER057c/UK114 family)